ncbi:MAG: hypothetical protein ACR2M0_00460 [Chloroflexia bacterium]
MLHDATGQRCRPERDYIAPTRADVEKAVRKVALFAKRNKYMREAGVRPPVLAQAVQPGLF